MSRWTVVVAGLLVCVASGTANAQQYTFEEVAAGLKHPDPATRVRAIEILKEAGYPDGAAPIGEALGDPDDRVQMAALDAERSLFTMRPISRRRRVGFVIERRSSAAAGDVAAEGRLALKAMRVPPQLLSGLVLALSDVNPRVRAEAIGLAALLGPVACPVQLLSAQLCAQVGNVLIENINSREPAVRRSAMLALGQLRYPNAVMALSDQLSFYQNGPDALAALEGLSGIGHASSASIFEQVVASPNAGMRRLGVEGLARTGNREALPMLDQMSQRERSNDVLLALHYAGLKLEAPGSNLSALVASLRDAALRPLSVQYLLDLSPMMGLTIAESLRDENAEVRRLVADVLGFSRDDKVVPALAAAAKDPDPDVALAAQRALERLKL